MPVKGKQLIDNTITQPKLNLADPVLPYDAATKQYVDEQGSTEFNSIENKNMSGLLTTSDGSLATNEKLYDQPVSGTGVNVSINGVTLPCGDSITDACYFSPDGIYKRTKGNERVDDNLFWNGSIAGFELDVTDFIDFTYIISSKNDRVVTLNDGDVYVYDSTALQNIFKFNGADTETATVIIDGTSFEVGNVAGAFVFDIGNINGYEYTFTTKGEFITIDVNGSDYDIVFDGIGSLLFTVNLYNPDNKYDTNLFIVSPTTTQSIEIDVIGTAGKSFDIDWGDGQSTNILFTGSSQRLSHEYTAGTYQQRWIGDYEDITYLRDLFGNFISYVNVNSLKQFINLERLDLQSDTLTQDCSDWHVLSVLTKMKYFYISNTNLTGDISSWSAFSTWTNIENFYLQYNNFIGDISGWSTFSTWTKIRHFALVYNNIDVNTTLTGDLTGWSVFSVWTDIRTFIIRDHDFSGDVSNWSVFSTWTNISRFEIQNNNFTGNVSNWSAFEVWTNMIDFDILGNDLSGNISGWSVFSAWTNLTEFHIANNNFIGDVSGWSAFSTWTNMRLFRIYGNDLSGDITSWSALSTWTNIDWFMISQNNFTGDISGWSAFSTWTGVEYFSISENSLSGDISGWSVFASWSLLEFFLIDNNLFTGNVISWNNFSTWTNLTNFSIHNNSLSGDISGWSDFSTWTAMLFFDISNNNFSGDLTSWSSLSTWTDIRQFILENFSSTTTTLDFKIFGPSLSDVDLRNNTLNLTTIDGALAHLNTNYNTTPPDINCDIQLEGGTNASPTNGMSNTDIQGIITSFTNAGYTATITIN